MKITWFGQSCFQILSGLYRKDQQSLSIIINPFSDKTGLKLPKIQADILLMSQNYDNGKNDVKNFGNPFLVEAPGEYETKGVLIRAIPSYNKEKKNKNLIFKIDVENLKICHLGILSQKKLENEQLEEIGLVDILMIPIGGGETISAKEAKEIIGQIEPKIVVPMYYSIPKLKLKLEKLDNFLKIMGAKENLAQEQLKIQKGDKILEKEDGFSIVVLNPK